MSRRKNGKPPPDQLRDKLDKEKGHFTHKFWRQSEPKIYISTQNSIVEASRYAKTKTKQTNKQKAARTAAESAKMLD